MFSMTLITGDEQMNSTLGSKASIMINSETHRLVQNVILKMEKVRRLRLRLRDHSEIFCLLFSFTWKIGLYSV